MASAVGNVQIQRGTPRGACGGRLAYPLRSICSGIMLRAERDIRSRRTWRSYAGPTSVEDETEDEIRILVTELAKAGLHV